MGSSTSGRRGSRPHACDDECRAAVARYEAGQSLVDASSPRSAGWLEIRLRGHAIPIRRRGEAAIVSTLTAAVMAERYLAGETLQEIGRAAGVTRERVRQNLSSLGVKRRDARSYKRAHVCRRACAIVLDSPPPIALSQLAGLHAAETTYTRLARAARIHAVPLADRIGHRCDQRCETARRLLDEGRTLTSAALTARISETAFIMRFASYHPDWNWARKRESLRPKETA